MHTLAIDRLESVGEALRTPAQRMLVDFAAKASRDRSLHGPSMGYKDAYIDWYQDGGCSWE